MANKTKSKKTSRTKFDPRIGRKQSTLDMWAKDVQLLAHICFINAADEAKGQDWAMAPMFASDAIDALQVAELLYKGPASRSHGES